VPVNSAFGNSYFIQHFLNPNLCLYFLAFYRPRSSEQLNSILAIAALGGRGCKAAPFERACGFRWFWQSCEVGCYSRM